MAKQQTSGVRFLDATDLEEEQNAAGLRFLDTQSEGGETGIRFFDEPSDFFSGYEVFAPLPGIDAETRAAPVATGELPKLSDMFGPPPNAPAQIGGPFGISGLDVRDVVKGEATEAEQAERVASRAAVPRPDTRLGSIAQRVFGTTAMPLMAEAMQIGRGAEQLVLQAARVVQPFAKYRAVLDHQIERLQKPYSVEQGLEDYTEGLLGQMEEEGHSKEAATLRPLILITRGLAPLAALGRTGVLEPMPGLAAAEGGTKAQQALAIAKNALKLGTVSAMRTPGTPKERLQRGAITSAYAASPAFSGLFGGTDFISRVGVRVLDTLGNSLLSAAIVYPKLKKQYGENWWKQPETAANAFFDVFFALGTEPMRFRAAQSAKQTLIRQMPEERASIGRMVDDTVARMNQLARDAQSILKQMQTPVFEVGGTISGIRAREAQAERLTQTVKELEAQVGRTIQTPEAERLERGRTAEEVGLIVPKPDFEYRSDTGIAYFSQAHKRQEFARLRALMESPTTTEAEYQWARSKIRGLYADLGGPVRMSASGAAHGEAARVTETVAEAPRAPLPDTRISEQMVPLPPTPVDTRVRQSLLERIDAPFARFAQPLWDRVTQSMPTWLRRPFQQDPAVSGAYQAYRAKSAAAKVDYAALIESLSTKDMSAEDRVLLDLVVSGEREPAEAHAEKLQAKAPDADIQVLEPASREQLVGHGLITDLGFNLSRGFLPNTLATYKVEFLDKLFQLGDEYFSSEPRDGFVPAKNARLDLPAGILEKNANLRGMMDGYMRKDLASSLAATIGREGVLMKFIREYTPEFRLLRPAVTWGNPFRHIKQIPENELTIALGYPDIWLSPTFHARVAATRTRFLAGKIPDDIYWRELVELGVPEETYAGHIAGAIPERLSPQDLGDAQSVRRPPRVKGLETAQKLGAWIREQYGAIDLTYKYELYRTLRERGQSIKDAHANMEGTLFNFRDVPPLVSNLNFVPFAPRVLYNFSRIFAYHLRTKPLTFPLTLGVLAQGWTWLRSYQMEQLGITEEEQKKMGRRKLSWTTMPVGRRKNGKVFSVDLSWLVPFSELFNFFPTEPDDIAGSLLNLTPMVARGPIAAGFQRSLWGKPLGREERMAPWLTAVKTIRDGYTPAMLGDYWRRIMRNAKKPPKEQAPWWDTLLVGRLIRTRWTGEWDVKSERLRIRGMESELKRALYGLKKQVREGRITEEDYKKRRGRLLKYHEKIQREKQKLSGKE